MRNAAAVLAVAASSLFVLAACRDDTLVDLSGGVAGNVCNPVTGQFAPGATVTAQFTNPRTNKAQEKTTTADDSGFFKLGGLPETAVTLHVELAGVFENDIPDVDIAALKDQQLTDPSCRDPVEEPGKGVLVGQICNRHTGDYVSDGTVTVLLADGSTLEAHTDADGTFHLDGVPAGPQIVYVRAAGFQKTFRVDIQEGTDPTLLEDQDIVCEPYDPLHTGLIKGTICGTDVPGDPGGPLGGVHVQLEDEIDGVVYEDETIDDGTFIIAGIPTDGTLVVNVVAVKGAFAFRWNNVQVPTIAANPDGVDLTANDVDACQPLSPDDGRRYLVVQGTYDRVEHVLDRMGIQPDLVDGDPIDISDDWMLDAFGTAASLNSYDAVFVNCGADMGPLQFGLSPAIKQNLRDYVQGGGKLYVSDWAYDLVEKTWPEKINFLGDDDTPGSATHGAGERVYNARVLDPDLQDYVDGDNGDIDFAFDNFAVVSQVAPGVTTYLQFDPVIHVNAGEVQPGTPMTLGFNDGLGRVIFTAFHQEQDASFPCESDSDCDSGFACEADVNSLNQAKSCTATLDDFADKVLRGLIFNL